MNYELAKELKDAGYQQILSGDSHWITKIGDFVAFYRIDDNGDYRGINTSKDAVENDLCYLPTLSELIEMCGNKIVAIERAREGWVVTDNNPVSGFHRNGSTPEEAVAHLWLALNKK